MEYTIFNAACNINGDRSLIVQLIDLARTCNAPLSFNDCGKVTMVEAESIHLLNAALPANDLEYVAWRSQRVSSGTYVLPLTKLTRYEDLRKFISQTADHNLAAMVCLN